MNRWEEFRACFGQPLGSMDQVFALHFPEMRDKMLNTPQDPIHHGEGDVWTHTNMVLHEVRQHPRYLHGSPTDQMVLDWAAMLHDITKPFTTREENGRISAPHHSKKGAVWARGALWKMGVPAAVREQVCQLIVYHQTPFFALTRDTQVGEFLARKLSSDVDISLLCALAESDIRGRVCPDAQATLDNIALFEELCRELNCFDQEYHWASDYTRHHHVKSHGKVSADHPYHDEAFEVVMLCGLPASGKDTWAKDQDLPILSYDDERKKLGIKHGDSVGTIVHAVHDHARELLRKKQSFVWNATHLSTRMREPASALIRAYGGKIKVVCLEATMEDILSRNSARNNTLRNNQLLELVGNWEMPWAWEFEKQTIINTSSRPGYPKKMAI